MASVTHILLFSPDKPYHLPRLSAPRCLPPRCAGSVSDREPWPLADGVAPFAAHPPQLSDVSPCQRCQRCLPVSAMSPVSGVSRPRLVSRSVKDTLRPEPCTGPGLGPRPQPALRSFLDPRPPCVSCRVSYASCRSAHVPTPFRTGPDSVPY